MPTKPTSEDVVVARELCITNPDWRCYYSANAHDMEARIANTIAHARPAGRLEGAAKIADDWIEDDDNIHPSFICGHITDTIRRRMEGVER